MFERFLNRMALMRMAPEHRIRLFPAGWEGIDPVVRQEISTLAAYYRQQDYPMRKATDFLAFVRDGSRKADENPYFDRRRKLCAAVMGLCIGEDDLDDVINGLWCICEESSWVISAHNINQIPGAPRPMEKPLPVMEDPNVDLFASQTAMILALTLELAGDRLDAVTPILRRRVENEIMRRVITPFMERDDYWWMGFIRKDLNNWTPWIVSNVLIASCGMELLSAQRAELIYRALVMLNRWLDVVPQDGGCDEGAGYWNLAGGALLDCLEVLETITNGQLTVWTDTKLRAIMRFPAAAKLHNGWFVNFADCDARPQLAGERLQYAGERLEDAELMAMGRAMRGSIYGQLSDTPQFWRALKMVFHPAGKDAAYQPEKKDVWLPDLQLRIREDEGFLLCCKGGHNGENHNHNDVGSFMLYVDGEPVLVDAGNMIYTAKTFSEERYTLWNTRAAYHNIPLIGGCEQRPGREYAARDCRVLPGGLSLDMAGAYGPEACVREAKRFVSVSLGFLMLQDEISLTESRPVTWVLMLRHKPEQREPGYWLTGGLGMIVDQDMAITVEEIPVTDARMAGSFPGSLWRMTLTAPAAKAHDRSFIVERT